MTVDNPSPRTRIILDAKQSQVTRATRRLYKSELPRISDAVYDLLALMSTARPGEIVTQFVADIVDAFWLIPINKDEQRFFVARFRNNFLVFNRTAQGSRTAPLTFAAIMSTAGRLLQSLLLRNHLGQQIWQDGRLEVYVDDPWACFKGTQGEISDLVACLLIGWELLGFPIAYHKATMAVVEVGLAWISTFEPDSIEVHPCGQTAGDQDHCTWFPQRQHSSQQGPEEFCWEMHAYCWGPARLETIHQTVLCCHVCTETRWHTAELHVDQSNQNWASVGVSFC